MKNLLFTLLIAAAMLLSIQSHAQTGVAINPTGADADNSAMLDVSAGNKGILVPRMTALQRTGILNPAKGLLVYQNDGTEGFYYFDGTAWTRLANGTYTETDPVVKAINGIVKSNGTTISSAMAGTDYLTPSGSAASLTSFPTLNQNTTGTAANVTGTVAITNGGTGTTTKAAAFDALSPMTAQGDVIYGGASGTAANLTKGTAGQVLTMNSGATAPQWSTPTTGTVTNVTGTVPISVTTGTTTPSITISSATTSAAGTMSASDKTKLDGISGTNTGDETNATIKTKLGITTLSGSNTGDNAVNTLYSGLVNYTHPTGDGNLHVLATSTTNSGKVLTAGATAGSLSWTTPTTGTVTSVTGNAPITVATGTSTPEISIAAATTSAAGTMSASDKTKLDGISGTNTGDQTLSGLGGVAANTAITGATKTKVTYDAKGLVTAGADATTADIAASANKNYVTDAQAVVIGNTSGTNTGDNAVNSNYSSLVSNATHTGDAEGAAALTVKKINGVALSGLATGILKNTTTTGVPTIAVAGTDYLSPATGWSLSGNTGTMPGTNFIGTKDNQSLIFKVNNVNAGEISSGSNTSFGYQALASNTYGLYNLAIGQQALYNNINGSGYNTANGNSALEKHTTGSFNTALGYASGNFITDGSTNNTTSTYSVYLGAATRAFADGQNNEIVIGSVATGAGSNTATLGNTSITTTVLRGNVRHYGTTQGYVGLQAPATVLTPYSLTLPTAAPASNGQVLSATTAGVMSWTTPSTGTVTIANGGTGTTTGSITGTTALTFAAGGSNQNVTLTPSGTGSIVLQGSTGINITGSSPDSKAILDLSSTTKGFLPPRMTFLEKTAITSPPAGLVVWCTNCGTHGELQVFNGDAWTNLIGGAALGSIPGAPTIGTATAGDGQASVSFTAPAFDGGSAITSYTATSTPGSFTGTMTQAGSGTITVTGLTNGTAYTFTVKATNANGTGASSAVSNAVTPAFACGSSFTDIRDSKVYTTVQIGTQCWMAQNLNVGTMIQGTTEQTNNSPTPITEKYCYSDLETNCDVYGGLYQWDEAMQYSTTPGVQGICPTGWHLPTDPEWITLTTFIGAQSESGGRMKETGTAHWTTPNEGATNTSGFTGLPGGIRFTNGSFNNIGVMVLFHSSSQVNTTDDWDWGMDYNNAYIHRVNYSKGWGLSVRCVR